MLLLLATPFVPLVLAVVADDVGTIELFLLADDDNKAAASFSFIVIVLFVFKLDNSVNDAIVFVFVFVGIVVIGCFSCQFTVWCCGYCWLLLSVLLMLL